jgi:hypothetical protein
MKDKVLYNTLKNIGTGDEYKSAPDDDYLKALETIGMIKMGWDNELTSLGKEILGQLRDKLEKW